VPPGSRGWTTIGGAARTALDLPPALDLQMKGITDMSSQIRFMVVAVVTFALLLGPATLSASAAVGGKYVDQFATSGQVRHTLPNGNLVVITVTGPTGVLKMAAPATAGSNNVTVGIDEYNCCGALLWTFTETVYWSWDDTQVNTDSPFSSASTSAPGWYVSSQPAPDTFWVVFPTREGNHAQATFNCCGPFPSQTQNPQITIQVDALGGWSAQTQCC
jgi:hypothetical protein